MKQIGYKEYGLLGSGDGAKEKLYKTDDGRYLLRGIGDKGVKTGRYKVTGFIHNGVIQEKYLTKEEASIWALSGMAASLWDQEFA